MSDERELLEQALAVLEAQRPLLGAAATDAAVGALHARLAVLAAHGPLERRHVTMLFGDVCGFTSLSEQMDPEDVGELMNRLWERVDAAILRHGGHIDKHIGDAVMALWGADGAREDDPARALHAALEILAQLPTLEGAPPGGLHMRIGIHTGPALLGVVGTLGEHTVMGDTVNTASRLEQAAPVDGVLVSHGTWRQVSGEFVGEPCPPLRLKGKQEPLQVYRVTAARPRTFRSSRGRGLEGLWARLVGRDEEMRQLYSALDSVRAAEGVQCITLTGEAGMGKSRLLGEFETWLESLPSPPLCMRGRASPEMRRHPNALLRDLFSFHLQVQESDPPSVVRARLEESFSEALGPDDSSRLRAHLTGSLIGFDFSNSPHLRGMPRDEQSLRAQGLAALGEYCRALLQRESMVLFLEDLHWADDSSLNVLEQLFAHLASERLLVLCTARPEFFERRPRWVQSSRHVRIELRPLSPRDSHRLVEELLREVEAIPPALHELLATRAGGNPFYIEELLQMLLEEGVILAEGERWRVEPGRLTSLKVPLTLSGVLQARLDSLPPREREVLQRASVVGRTFWDEALLRMSPEATPHTLHDALVALQERELIFERSPPAFAGTHEYVFKNSIVREVAYDTVLKRERRVFHGSIAEWLLARGGERSREHLGLLADHLEASGQGARAATWLRRAGEEALSLFANAEALSFLERALALTPEVERAERYAIVAARERVHSVLGERSAQRQDLELMQTLSRQLGDARRQTEAALCRALYAYEVGDTVLGEEAAREAVRLSHETGDTSSEALAHLRWGRLLRHHQADFTGAQEHFERSLMLAEVARLPQLEIESLLNLSAVTHETGDLASSYAHIQRVLPHCRNMGDRWLESTALRYLAYTHKSLGDYASARAELEQALQFSRVIGYRFWECADLCNLALVHFHQGEPGRAFELADQALRMAVEIGSARHQGYAWMGRGLALIELGRLSEARDAFQAARRLRHEARLHHLEMESVTGLAAVALAAGDLPGAREHTETLLAHLERSHPHGVEQPFWMWLTCFQVLEALGDERAGRVLEAAHQHLHLWAERIPDEALRRSFLAIAAHHALRQHWQRRRTGGTSPSRQGAGWV